MRHISHEQIKSFERLYRANMINSCSGYKSANIIGTLSAKGVENAAIFSSVIHMGSEPPVLGFVMRPATVPRNTYENIRTSRYYTINHVTEKMVNRAHQTSAKYPDNISEFEETGLTPLYRADLPAPFVKESPLQLAMKFMEEIPIKVNGTILILGQILDIYCEEEMMHNDGFIQLSKFNVATINGLDGYAIPELKTRLSYARPKQKLEELK